LFINNKMYCSQFWRPGTSQIKVSGEGGPTVCFKDGTFWLCPLAVGGGSCPLSRPVL
jgi:hypothetical protein